MCNPMAMMREIKARMSTHNCPSCGGGAYCAMEAGKSASTCWCMTAERERKPESSEMGDVCLCKACLTGKSGVQYQEAS